MTPTTAFILLILPCLSVQMETVNVGVLVPKDDGNCTKTAIQMAIDEINGIDYINFNFTVYHLSPSYHDVSESSVEAMTVVNEVFSEPITSRPQFWIGPPYNGQDAFVGGLVSDQSFSTNAMPIFSYTGRNGGVLSIPFQTQTSPSTQSFIAAFPSLLKYFNWTKAAVLTDLSNDNYNIYVEKMAFALADSGVEILTEQVIFSSPPESEIHKQMNEIEYKGSRIIFAMVGIHGARKVFCEAFKRNLYKPNVMWMLFETLEEGWAGDRYDAKEGREISCSENELLLASNGYISIQKSHIRSDGKQSIANHTSKAFMEVLDQKLGQTALATCNRNIAYSYDTVWLAAEFYKKHFHSPRPFVFGIQEDHKHIDFEGITGPIHFDVSTVTKVRQGELSIFSNNLNQEPFLIGHYFIKSRDLQLLQRDQVVNVLFEDGKVLADSATTHVNYTPFKKAVLFCMWGLAIAGILFTIIVTIINCIYACQQMDKEINNVMIDTLLSIGGILCYISVIVYGLDIDYVQKDNIPKMCTAFSVVLSVGFTLMFGAMLTKIWQMYDVHCNNDAKAIKKGEDVKVAPEWRLCIWMALFILGDAIILSIWFKLSPFHNRYVDISDSPPSLFVDVIEKEKLIRCECDDRFIFTIAIYCYKGLLVVFGLFFSSQTISSTLDVLSGSKDIAMAIGNVTVVSIIAVVCASVVEESNKYDSLYVIVAVCIIFGTTTSLVLVFFRRIQAVLCSSSVDLVEKEAKSRSVMKKSNRNNYKQKMTSSNSGM